MEAEMCRDERISPAIIAFFMVFLCRSYYRQERPVIAAWRIPKNSVRANHWPADGDQEWQPLKSWVLKRSFLPPKRFQVRSKRWNWPEPTPRLAKPRCKAAGNSHSRHFLIGRTRKPNLADHT